MKISHIIIASSIFLGITKANAQLVLGGHFYGEEAFKFSEFKTSGTARMQGMGGGYSALGGDATSAVHNPAGLGFYNRSELSITPVFNSVGTSANYIDSKTNFSTSNANIGQLGLIMSSSGTGTRKKRSSLAITYSRQANLFNEFRYAGQNKRSSMADFFAEKATQRGANVQTLEDEFDDRNTTAETSTSMYYWSYLIDPTTNGGKVFTKSETSLPTSQSGVNQTTGSTSQWNIGYGVNFDDKTYIGLSVGFMRLNYEYVGNHTERFSGGKFFNGFEFNDDLITRGGGVNIALGGILKVSDNISLGASVTTPTWLSLTETYNNSIIIDPKSNLNTNGIKEVSTIPYDFQYTITTPLRANGGGAFFFGDKKGFIALDAEYVGYKSMNVKDSQDATWSSDQRRGIRTEYRNAFNFKVGAEYRINNIRLRGGAKYLGDPFTPLSNPLANSLNTDNSQLLFSGGIGYRSAKFFIDLAGVFNTFNTSYTPYQLKSSQDFASASIANNRNSFVVSVGTFF